MDQSVTQDGPGSSESDLVDGFSVKTHSVSLGRTTVAIIGNGTFGRALGHRMHESGAASVIYGSRNFSDDDDTTSIEDAARQSDIIILAVPPAAYDDVIKEIAPALRENVDCDKPIIDVSNKPPRKLWSRNSQEGSSYAQELAQKLRDHGLFQPVVKCFNTVSAYTLNEDGIRSPQTVHLCGDETQAKDKVTHLVRSMGLLPLDIGNLASSKFQESLPHVFFKTWKTPFILSVALFLFWGLYISLRVFVIKIPGESRTILPSQALPFSVFLGTTGQVGITLFALVFLASFFAGCVQLKRKTASRPFGWFLGFWLTARKPMGLIAFFNITLHAIVGSIVAVQEGRGFQGQLYVVFGTVSFGLFLVLAASSNTSISSNLSWVEFRFIFSWLGFGGLAFGIAHVVTFGTGVDERLPGPSGWPGALMPSWWLGIILPLMAVSGKIILTLPCFGRPLAKIRGTA